MIHEQEKLMKLNIQLSFHQDGVEINHISIQAEEIKNEISLLFQNMLSSNRFDLGTCTIHALKMEFKQSKLFSNLRYDPNPKIRNQVQLEINVFTFISKLDLVPAYMKIPYYPDDKDVIGRHFGSTIFSILRLTIGGKNSSFIFQSIFDKILQGMSATSYQNDCWIFTQGTFAHHKEEVFKVCYKINQHSLKINLNKCDFATFETEILGHIINCSETKMSLKFTRILSQFPMPTNIHQL
ncbi:Reverse transcriptase domain-containing protein [Strongyloides ratti]|uniref:Reverse transcriptase domain-containing protein n=1 Tax=Strongyloides ratti TaxID=34506 RepID=A0A090KV14_STRRB|nr:Reverse transcriptase domain-containing protein [Strongyloides ratti]CEF61360.1 Reverse transcriptase domain-containing protein [Strongyloides ratti]